MDVGADEGEPAATEPDARFTLANERMFLAWIRTSLGLLAAGVAVVQFAPDLGFTGARTVAGLAFVVLADISALAAGVVLLAVGYGLEVALTGPR